MSPSSRTRERLVVGVELLAIGRGGVGHLLPPVGAVVASGRIIYQAVSKCQVRSGSRRPANVCYLQTDTLGADVSELARRLPDRPPRRGRSRDRRGARRRARPPAEHARDDRLRELRAAGGARGGRLGADQQVRRGLSRASATTAAASEVDVAEQLAIDRAKELFGAEHANVQPHAGAQANNAAYMALLEPGDTIMGMALDHGGHLTPRDEAERLGQALRRRRLPRAPRGHARRHGRGRASSPRSTSRS